MYMSVTATSSVYIPVASSHGGLSHSGGHRTVGNVPLDVEDVAGAPTHEHTPLLSKNAVISACDSFNEGEKLTGVGIIEVVDTQGGREDAAVERETMNTPHRSRETMKNCIKGWRKESGGRQKSKRPHRAELKERRDGAALTQPVDAASGTRTALRVAAATTRQPDTRTARATARACTASTDRGV